MIEKDANLFVDTSRYSDELVLKNPPFVYANKKLHEFLTTNRWRNIQHNSAYVVLDYDGVIYEPNQCETQFTRLRSLKQLTSNARHVDIITARTVVDDSLPNFFPLMTNSHRHRLEAFFRPAEVNVHASLKKLFHVDCDYYLDIIRNYESVLFVGSGVFDIVRFKKILFHAQQQHNVRDFSHLTLITTGHLLL